MTNDSKLGLVAGVTAVLLIAVVYYQKGTATSSAPANTELNRTIMTPPPAATPAEPPLR